MGQDINVKETNGKAKEQLEPTQSQEVFAEQAQAQLYNDLINGLSGGNLNLNTLNSGLGFGGIFGASQLNVNEKELADLSKSFLGFTMGASNMSFGLGENLMSGAMNNWFQSFMNCFTGGATSAGDASSTTATSSDVKTTLITKPEAEATAEATTEETGVTSTATIETVTATSATTTVITTVEAKKTEKAQKKAEADKKSLSSDDLTVKNREQFLMWLDEKSYTSKIGSDQNLIDYTDSKGNNVSVEFNDAGQPIGRLKKNKDTNIRYSKNGSKSVSSKTEESERYTYSTVTDYDANGKKKSYKQTEEDSGNYFTRQWVGASGIDTDVLVKREYGLTKPIDGLEKGVAPPAFKSGNTGFQYNPQKGILDGKDVTYKNGTDGNFSKTDKKTGITCEYDKDGKLLKQYDLKHGIIRDFKKNGSYDEHYKKEWIKP